MRRLHPVALVLALAFPAACAAPADPAVDGTIEPFAGGKADEDHPLALLGEDATLELAAMPLSAPEREALRATEHEDLSAVADLFDATFGGTAREALDAFAPTDDDVRRAMMFASAHELEPRDSEAEVAGVTWTADDLRALYALAWLGAPESLRVSLGDGTEALNPALFHAAFTQLMAQGHAVVTGPYDTAGSVFTDFAIRPAPREEGAAGPRLIDREAAEAYTRTEVVDADAYWYVFASIGTSRGFASESYVLATDADGDLVAGYWTAPNDAFPQLHPTRLWFAPARPADSLVDFASVDAVAAAFEETVPGAVGDIYYYDGEPVAFTESRFHCARVGLILEDRFRVGAVTVRADFRSEGWLFPDLEVSLYHSPIGAGPSLVTLAEDHDEETGEWTTDEFAFDGSESANAPWELRVCDTSGWGDEEDLSGYVDYVELEFHPVD